MEKKIDWSKAPNGATHYCLDDPGRTAWRDLSGKHAKYWDDGEWKNHGLTPEFCFKHAEFEARPVAPAWPAEGVLPPVETVCEMHRETYFEIDWQPVTLLCVGQAKAFFRDKEGHEWSRPLRELSFRPIRTAEQIAAEESKLRVAELAKVIKESGWRSPEILAAYLDSHDYRKQ